MTKRMVSAVALWLAAAVASAQGVGGLTNYPTIPRAEPRTEIVHGVTVSDPYRWMERVDRRPEMVDWVNAASRHSLDQIAALPGHPALLRDLQAALTASTYDGHVRPVGNRVFFWRIAPDRPVPVLMVRDGEHDRLLLDPMADAASGAAPHAISNFVPSPSGRLIAVAVAAGGGEVAQVRFLDVATGRALPDVLAPIWGEFEVNWIDDRTVTYTRMNNADGGEDAMQNMLVYRHRLGTPAEMDMPVLGARQPHGFEMPAVEFPSIQTYANSRWALIAGGNARADLHLGFGLAAELAAGKPAWHPIADHDDQVTGGDLDGDTLYYLTTKADPNGEIRAVDLRPGATLAASRLVMPSGGLVLRSMQVTAAGVYAQAMAPDGSSRLYFVAGGRGRPVEVKLPVIGSAFDFAVAPDRRQLTIGLDAITRNATHYRLDGATLVPFGFANPTLPIAAAQTVRVVDATSADGTQVPLTIVAPAGPVRPRPTMVEAYASYGQVSEPIYSPVTPVWVARGGVSAICHARGGGEKGRAWHEGGRSANKVNAMADVIACGERLVQLGYTTPRLMGLQGGSAGGLLVTPVGLKRPDLFAAVVTRVGIVNPTRLAVANNGPNQFAEMGDPGTDAGFRALAAQDSTLLLPQAHGGTDQLFAIGLNDHRVDPWMSAKLAAMMRTRWGDEHLVLIRSDADAGHGIGSTRDQFAAEQADVWAFLLNRFEEPGFVR